MALGVDGNALDRSSLAGSSKRIPTTESSQTTSSAACSSGSSPEQKLTRRSCSPSHRRLTSISAATASQCSTKSGTSSIGNLKGLTSVDNWRWPGEVSSPEAVSMNENALQASKVVHCRLVLFDDNVASGQTIRVFFPGENTIINSAVHVAPLGVKTGFNRGSLKDYEEHEDG